MRRIRPPRRAPLPPRSQPLPRRPRRKRQWDPSVKSRHGDRVDIRVCYPQSLTDPFGGHFHYIFPDEEVYSGTRYERIEGRSRKSSWLNPVFHETIHCHIDQHKIPPYLDEGGLVWSRLSAGDGESSFVPRSMIHRAVGLPTLGSLSEAAIRARVHAIAALDPEVDLFAFLGELHEGVTGAIKFLWKLKWKAFELRNNCIYYYDKFRKERPNLNTAACWKLAWDFGVKPFLSDLEALGQATTKSIKRIEWLRKRNGKPTLVKSRYKTDSFQFDQQPGCLIIDEGAPGSSSARAVRTGLFIQVDEVEFPPQITFCVSNLVKFDIPTEVLGPANTFNRKGWAAAYGMYNPVATAWELTKFSWLIDWFVGYRNRVTIRDLSLSPLKDASIVATLTSIKIRYFGKVFLIVDDGKETSGHGEWGVRPNYTYIEIGKWDLKLYHRFPGEFSEEWAPQLNVPIDWNKLALSLALIVQRFHRRVR